jgi:hypothetical protein
MAAMLRLCEFLQVFALYLKITSLYNLSILKSRPHNLSLRNAQSPSTSEHFPTLRELTAWNTFKLQFVAISSLFKTKAMFMRVIVATITM